MNIETLARLIAEKVLTELVKVEFGKPEFDEHKFDEHGIVRKKNSRVLVFGEESATLTQSLQQIVGSDCSLVYYHKDITLEGYARYIVPYLCCPNMAALALGLPSSPITLAVLRLLLDGHEVEVLEFEYERYQSTATDGLYGLYKKYAGTLRSYGLVPLNTHAATIARSRESLITEKLVRETAQQGYAGLLVPEKAIITDLAEETAQAINFQLHRAPKEG